MPQIGTGNTPLAGSLSQPNGAGNPAKLPFSAALEQAKPFPDESQSDADSAAGQGCGSRGTGLFKREAKTTDSKSNDPQKSGNHTAETASSSADAQACAVPVVVVHTQSSSVLSSSAAMKDFVTGAAAGTDRSDSNTGTAGQQLSQVQPWSAGVMDFVPAATNANRSNTSSDRAGQTVSLPASSKDPTPTKNQADTSSQDSPSVASAQATNVDAIKAGALAAEAEAGLMTKPVGTAPSDSRTQSGDASLQTRPTAHETAEPNDGVQQAKAAVKFAIEHSVPPRNVGAPSYSFPVPEKLDNGSSQDVRTKPVLDKARVGVTQENQGANRKTVDVTGTVKTQSRKEDTPSSTGSTVVDRATVVNPTKPLASTTGFSVAGVQTSSAAVDGKTVTAGAPREGSDVQPGHLDQKSTGVAQSHPQGEGTAPYPTSVVHSAKLVERMGETELRLGIRAGEFGRVDVRTSMVRNQFTAEISTDRGELGRALAAELPNLQSRLTDQRVPVANITVQDHTGGHSAPSEQQHPRHGQSVYPMNPGVEREEGPMPAGMALEATAEASRLDIRM